MSSWNAYIIHNCHKAIPSNGRVFFIDTNFKSLHEVFVLLHQSYIEPKAIRITKYTPSPRHQSCKISNWSLWKCHQIIFVDSCMFLYPTVFQVYKFYRISVFICTQQSKASVCFFSILRLVYKHGHWRCVHSDMIPRSPISTRYIHTIHNLWHSSSPNWYNRHTRNRLSN